MGKLTTRLTKTILLLSLSALLLRCSGDDEAPTQPPVAGNAIDTFEVSPTRGMAGSLVAISGLPDNFLSATDVYAFYLRDQEAPFAVGVDSAVSVALPLFIDSTGWSNPPAEPMILELWRSDSLVAVARQGLTVTPLERADGTLDSIRQSVLSVSSSINALYANLPVFQDREGPIRDGIGAMLDGLVLDGDTCLQSILDGSSSVWQGEQPDLELIDAILAATGAADWFAAYADGLKGLQDSVTRIRASSVGSIYCEGESAPDMDLACQMQVFVLMDAFTQQFVKPTASAYNNTIGLAAGLAAISGVGTIPGVVAEITGALLTIEAFIMEKLVVAALPSDIVAFAMALQSDTISVGEMTNSSVVITATNTPVSITLNDIISTVLASMPFLDLPSSDRFGEVLLRAAQFVIDLYRNILLEYESTHPGSFTDPELTQIPTIYYGPVLVTHSDLVELFTLNPDIVEPVDSAVEWLGLKRGTAAIRAQTRGAQARSKLVRDWMFFTTYYGGAFGEELVSTDNAEVVVTGEGELIVNINGLPEGSAGSVQVTGPDDFGAGLSATDTITGLAPGDYTIHGLSVTIDGKDYFPSPEFQTVTVLDKETTEATVTYNASFGSIYLIISGLDSGVDADVTVSGPGTSIHITGESFYSGNYRNRIDSLAPGEYTITANNVSDNDGVTFIPVPASQNVTVVSDSTSEAQVDYQAPVFLRLLAGTRSDGECLSLSYSQARETHFYWNPDYTEDWIADTSCAPDYAGFPFYYYSDTCGQYFDIGRSEVTGPEVYTSDASAGSASANLLLTVQSQENRSCRFEWTGEANASLPGAGADEIWGVSAQVKSVAGFDSAYHPLYYIEIENTGYADAFMSRSYSMQIIESGGAGATWVFSFCDKYLTCLSSSWGSSNCFFNHSSSANGDTLVYSYDGSNSFSARIPGKTTIRMGITFDLLLGASASYDHRYPNNAVQGGNSTINGYIEYFIKRQEK